MKALARARAAWGARIPEWVEVLAKACDTTSQRQAAEQIGYSPAAVSQMLSRQYKGASTAIEQAVRGAFIGETRRCPVLGEIPAPRCREERGKPFANSNPVRVALFRACRECNSHQEGESR